MPSHPTPLYAVDSAVLVRRLEALEQRIANEISADDRAALHEQHRQIGDELKRRGYRPKKRESSST